MQSAVPVLPGDDEHALAARVLATEHVIYPKSVRWFVEGRLRLVDGLVEQAQGASQLLLESGAALGAAGNEGPT
jgi:phosphoribosylglycinamide formyltransferase-1